MNRDSDAGVSHVAATVMLCALMSGTSAIPARAQEASSVSSIPVVTNPASRWPAGAGWHLSSVPTLRIGTAEGDANLQFYNIASVLRLGDGRIVVANAGTRQLRLYDSTGRFVKSAGHQGGGPGEFQALSWVATLAGDTLLAWDQRQGRLSYFTPSGDYVRSVPVRDGRGLPPRLLGAWEDGTTLGTVRMNQGLPSGRLVRDTLEYLIFAPDGSVRDSAGLFPGYVSYQVVTKHGSGFSISGMTPPFPRVGEEALGPAGFYFGTGESFAVTLYSRTGAPVRIVQWAMQPRPVTGTLKARYLVESRQWTSNENAKRMQARMLRDVRFPATLPTYEDLLVDAGGDLWVRGYRFSADSAATWQVFDPRGHWLGGVRFPARFTPSEIGTDYVLGVWQDAENVEYVAMYRLEKGP